MKSLPTLFSRTSTGAVQTWQMVVDGNQYYVISGQQDGKKVQSEPTICEAKNIGRANATTPAEQALMDEEEAEIAKIVKKYNQRMAAIDTFNRGWLQKSRKQHFQGGGGAKTNYFTHPSRSQCEQNALDYAKQ